MYHKVSERLADIGRTIKEATGEIPKTDVKKVIQKIKKIPIEVLKDLGKEVSKEASDVTSGVASKLVGLIALVSALAAAAGTPSDQVGKQLAQADTSTKVEMILDSLLSKVDAPVLTMKGPANIQKINQEINDAAFSKMDPRVGPTQGKA
jgi:hypothetical protein